MGRERKRRGRWETYNAEYNADESFSSNSVIKEGSKDNDAPGFL